jgi:hypothetical protein
MDAMCKAGVLRKRILTAVDHALHFGLRLSTAFLEPFVQTVGNAGPNSSLFTAVAPFPFLGTQFSKTGMTTIPAPRLVTGLLSTFPARTVTTTNKE